MKFRVFRTTDRPRASVRVTQPCPQAVREGSLWYIEIETIDQLMCLRLQVEEALVISSDSDFPTIEIYDDCRE